jgi:uncharacterized protein
VSRDLLYVDASAFLRLVFTDDSTPALTAVLWEWPDVVSSEVLEVEARRAGLREQRQHDVERLLDGVTLLPFTAEIRERAGTIGTGFLRALDAIHLATAEALGPGLGLLVSYDVRQVNDGLLERLPVASPRPDP